MTYYPFEITAPHPLARRPDPARQVVAAFNATSFGQIDKVAAEYGFAPLTVDQRLALFGGEVLVIDGDDAMVLRIVRGID